MLRCKGGWGEVVGGGGGVMRPGRVVCGNIRFTACVSRDSVENMWMSLCNKFDNTIINPMPVVFLNLHVATEFR